MQFYGTERIYNDGWRKVPLPSPGSGIAGVDLGINNLFAAYGITADGRHVSVLFNGRPLKSIWYYWKRKIAKYQSMLNKHGPKTSRRLRLMNRKAKMQMKNYIDHQIRGLFRWLRMQGIGAVVVGLPHDIAHSNGNEYTVRIWMYGYVVRRLRELSEEESIAIHFVSEEYSSITDPFSGVVCKRCRRRRGLFYSPSIKKLLNADLVGAFNILKRFLHNPESPAWGIGVTGRRPAQGQNKKDVAPNLPALATPRTLAL